MSISLVLKMLPATAPKLPHSTAGPVSGPTEDRSPSMNVVTISPMPKEVPRLVRAGI